MDMMCLRRRGGLFRRISNHVGGPAQLIAVSCVKNIALNERKETAMALLVPNLESPIWQAARTSAHHHE